MMTDTEHSYTLNPEHRNLQLKFVQVIGSIDNREQKPSALQILCSSTSQLTAVIVFSALFSPGSPFLDWRQRKTRNGFLKNRTAVYCYSWRKNSKK